MRISDWSSDVCSSDLSERFDAPIGQGDPFAASQHRCPLRQIQAGGKMLAVAEPQAATPFGVAIELAIRARQYPLHIDIAGVAIRGAIKSHPQHITTELAATGAGGGERNRVREGQRVWGRCELYVWGG